ncbi:MAG TPA: DUF6569 family protein [Blastocatellia bacterium]|nr:DUF6569 family protein [Blastocatellia bacterium]
MKSRIAFVLGILLFGLTLVYIPQERAVVAAGENNSARNRGRRASPATLALSEGWRIGAPIKHEKLTLYPIISDRAVNTDRFITLDEGFKSGKVTVAEAGESGGEVNKLMVTNRSGKMLVLIAGEIVKGGKQDRIVGHDCIIASSETPVPIDVFCIEQGRWEARSAGRSQRRSNRTRNRSGGTPSVGGGSGGRSNSFVAGSGSAETVSALPDLQAPDASMLSTPGVIAPPDVREKAQADKDQGKVWDNVRETSSANEVVEVTGTLNGVYEDRRVARKIKSYEHGLKSKLTASNVVGLVIAVNGEIVSADVFASPELFQAYRSKLIKSYALGAISTKATRARRAKAVDPLAFLTRVAGERPARTEQASYRLVEHQSKQYASFELEFTADERAVLVHFNRVARK